MGVSECRRAGAGRHGQRANVGARKSQGARGHVVGAAIVVPGTGWSIAMAMASKIPIALTEKETQVSECRRAGAGRHGQRANVGARKSQGARGHVVGAAIVVPGTKRSI